MWMLTEPERSVEGKKKSVDEKNGSMLELYRGPYIEED
jgi:hypothetical protein